MKYSLLLSILLVGLVGSVQAADSNSYWNMAKETGAKALSWGKDFWNLDRQAKLDTAKKLFGKLGEVQIADLRALAPKAAMVSGGILITYSILNRFKYMYDNRGAKTAAGIDKNNIDNKWKNGVRFVLGATIAGLGYYNR